MSTYDHITNQFEPNLSPLAKRMYAALFDGTSKPGVVTYMSAWYIADELGDRDMLTSDEWDYAIADLIAAFLVRELPDLHYRYELTSRAWRAHLLHAQAVLKRGGIGGRTTPTRIQSRLRRIRRQ